MAKAKSKPARKKAAPKRAAAKKPVAKKAAPKKAAPKKAAAKKTAPRKVAAKKTVAKKAAPKAKKPPVPKGTYTKGDIVDHLAFKLDVTKKTANEFLDELTVLVAKNAKKDFTLPGLGKFYTAKQKKRNGRNPATGAPLVIPAKNVVKFRVGKALKDAVYPPKK